MIRTGDTVRHIPSGEKWLVAYAENGFVCACGWPETKVRIEDCELVRACSDQQNQRLLYELADKRDYDSRKAYAVRELERRRIERESEAYKG